MTVGAGQPSPAEQAPAAHSRTDLEAAEPPPTGAPVLSRVVAICNKRGLHARAAARFVTMAERFGASVDVLRDGQTVSARSIMGQCCDLGAVAIPVCTENLVRVDDAMESPKLAE